MPAKPRLAVKHVGFIPKNRGSQVQNKDNIFYSCSTFWLLKLSVTSCLPCRDSDITSENISGPWVVVFFSFCLLSDCGSLSLTRSLWVDAAENDQKSRKWAGGSRDDLRVRRPNKGPTARPPWEHRESERGRKSVQSSLRPGFQLKLSLFFLPQAWSMTGNSRRIQEVIGANLF